MVMVHVVKMCLLDLHSYEIALCSVTASTMAYTSECIYNKREHLSGKTLHNQRIREL
jgi:hypothetical protein